MTSNAATTFRLVWMIFDREDNPRGCYLRQDLLKLIEDMPELRRLGMTLMLVEAMDLSRPPEPRR